MKKSLHINLTKYFGAAKPVDKRLIPKTRLPIRHAVSSYYSRDNEEAIEQEFDGYIGFLYYIELKLMAPQVITLQIDQPDLHVFYMLSSTGIATLLDCSASRLFRLRSGRARYVYLPSGRYGLEVPPDRSQLFGLYFRASIFRSGNERKYSFLHPLLEAHRQKSHQPVVSVDFRVGPITRRHIASLCENLQAKQLHNETFILEKLIQLIELSREKVYEEYEKTTSDQNILTQAIRLIDSYVSTHGQAFRIQDIADAIGISNSHLHHVFKRQVNTPPKTYKDQRVMQRCREQLLEYDQIADVAERCGFSSVAAFSQYFKKKTGQTATEYRLSQQPVQSKN